MTLDHIPTWRLILEVIKNIIQVSIPIIVLGVCIILFMRACGDMPY